MADGRLTEPLIADAEGLDFPFLDEAILQELKQLDDAEAGWAGESAEHVEDEDVLRMRQLIREKPKDVIQYLEEEGVAKLGDFEVQDAVVFKAFGKDSIMTMGADHYEVDWESMWKERLSEYSRSTAGMGWTTKILMEAHVVNLRDAAAEGSKGLLHPLLKRWHARGTSSAVFGLPAVQAVIHFKWNSWSRRFLLYELACYCAWLASFTTFTLVFQQEDWTMTFWETMKDRNGFLATVFSLVTLVPMAPFLYMELCTIAAYGWGWLGAWNLLDIVSYVLQIVICILHLQRTFMDEGWFSVLVATQHVLMWTKLHYFAKVFNPTKNTIVDTIRIVLDDMKWFLFFLALTMLGFGLAFYALFRQDRERFADFTNIWHSFASMFSYMLAMFDYNVFYGSTNPTAAMLLFIAFEFVMNVLLLNILIASMTSSFSKITQDEGLRFLCSKAEIIDELETTLPHWIKRKTWYPSFIHILKIHPDSTYEVNLNSVWSGIGLMENNLLGAQQETRLRVEELEDRLGKLHKKLDVLIKLFISSMGPGQAIGISRQATVGMPGVSAGSGGAYFGAGTPFKQGAGGPPLTPRGATFGPSSTQAREAAAVGAAAASGAASSHSRYLHHAATTLTHLPEQLASVSGPFASGPYMSHGLGFGAQGFYPIWGLGPGYAPPVSPGPFWGTLRPVASRTRRGSQDVGTGAGVAAAAATATAASAPAGMTGAAARRSESGEKSLNEWAEAMQQDAGSLRESASVSGESPPRRRSSTSGTAGGPQQMPRTSVHRPSAVYEASRSPGVPYGHRGIDRLGSTGHSSMYPPLAGTAAHYSMAGYWPAHAAVNPFGYTPAPHDVYHMPHDGYQVGPGFCHSGFVPGHVRHAGVRGYGLDAVLRRRRGGIVRSSSF